MPRVFFAVMWLVDGIAGVVYRMLDWLLTRPTRPLLVGSPALLLGMGLVGVLSFEWFGFDAAVTERYQQAVEDAFDRNDKMAAEIYVRKLAMLDASSDTTRFGLAQLAEQRGDLKRAEELMSKLAPADAAGYPRAHLWMAQHLWHEGEPYTDGKSELLIHHLNEALKSVVQRHEARLLLVRVHVARREFAKAAECLESAVANDAGLRFALAELYAAMGETRRFRDEIHKAKEHFGQLVESNRDDVPARLSLAKALLLNAEHQQAESVLLEGLATSDDKRLRAALSDLYVLASDQFASSDETQTSDRLHRRLELLQKALFGSPDNPDALIRLAAIVRSSEDEGKAARSILKDALARGVAPWTVHAILGTSAASEARWDEARLHLEQAHRLNPRLPALLNNLAWALAHCDPPELERALAVASSAVELAPTNPHVRETRGQIFTRLAKWEEARADLELALPQVRSHQRLHETLAEVYRQLGDQEMSEKHAVLADRAADDENGVE